MTRISSFRRSLRRLALATTFILPLAAAAQNAITTQAVNMRAGPDASFPLVAWIPGGAPVHVYGCVAGWRWCDTQWGMQRGWVWSQTLQTTFGQPQVVFMGGPALGIPLVTFSINSYWNSWYRNRPWWDNRNYWFNRPPPPPPPVWRPPPPGWRPPPPSVHPPHGGGGRPPPRPPVSNPPPRPIQPPTTGPGGGGRPPGDISRPSRPPSGAQPPGGGGGNPGAGRPPSGGGGPGAGGAPGGRPPGGAGGGGARPVQPASGAPTRPGT